MNIKYILTIICVLISITSYAQTTVNGFSMPESVTSDGSRFFVSNQGQDISSHDSDGFISEISADGKMVHHKFLPIDGVLHAPKGMAIVDGILYVADLDRIVGFDIRTRATVFQLSIAGASMLNDVSPFKKNSICVTETYSGDIYEIDLQNKLVTTVGNIPTVNGIVYNAETDQLVACSNGEPLGEGGIYMKEGTGDFQKLPNIARGFFDGMVWLDDNRLLISDWVTFPTKDYGKLWIYDLKSHQSRAFLSPQSVADIYYDPSTETIYMPQMLENKVIIMQKEDLHLQNYERYNKLYQYGIADAFAGGVYEGTLPLKDLLLEGDFGIGAPDMLDGELTILDGRVYQTRSTGETFESNGTYKTSLSFVTFFRADTVVKIEGVVNQEQLTNRLRSVISDVNSPHAFKIFGKFKDVKTRAFPAVQKGDSTPLVDLVGRQSFFDFTQTEGTLVGFFFPEYLNGLNIKGFHFHFLSSDKMQGGHVLDFEGIDLQIEIARINRFDLAVPTGEDFKNYHFPEKENESLKRVEQGK